MTDVSLSTYCNGDPPPVTVCYSTSRHEFDLSVHLPVAFNRFRCFQASTPNIAAFFLAWCLNADNVAKEFFGYTGYEAPAAPKPLLRPVISVDDLA